MWCLNVAEIGRAHGVPTCLLWILAGMRWPREHGSEKADMVLLRSLAIVLFFVLNIWLPLRHQQPLRPNARGILRTDIGKRRDDGVGGLKKGQNALIRRKTRLLSALDLTLACHSQRTTTL